MIVAACSAPPTSTCCCSTDERALFKELKYNAINSIMPNMYFALAVIPT
jgi:hypothetical protein